MQINKSTNDLNACNYKMFLYTVRNLASSQGFYSRLQNEIDSWDEDKHEEVKEYLNNKGRVKTKGYKLAICTERACFWFNYSIKCKFLFYETS